MSIKSGLIQHLTANAALKTLVGGRIRFGLSPAGDKVPRINITLITGDHAEHLGAASGKANGRFQFDCYGATPKDAARVADALREALHGFRGKAGDTWISTAHLDDERDINIEPHEGTDAEGGVFTVQQDYVIGWTTTIPTF